MLQKNALDQQAWFIKVRAATLKAWVDDTQLEEQGLFRANVDSSFRPLCCKNMHSRPRLLEQVLGTCCWTRLLCSQLLSLAHLWPGH
jgi:hypothetical protein